MSILSDIGTAIKNKLGGTSVDNTVPRYDGTTCKLQGSGVTISDTNAVTASGGFVGDLTGNLNGGYGTFSGLITTKLCNSAFNVASDNALSVRGNSTYPAYINFHRLGVYAANFGIDTDNKLKFGGWSAGSVYEIYHEGNQPPSVGVGQSWQNVTASRASGVTYTNSTGKPIMVVAFTSNNNDANIISYINGDMLNQSVTHSQYGGQNCIEFIVPNGATYRVQVYNTSIIKWSELR